MYSGGAHMRLPQGHPMKILVDIPDGATVGTATVMNTGGPEPGPGPTPPPPNPTPPPAAGDQPSPFGGTLPVQNLGTLQVGSGNHNFVPSSAFITTVQLIGDFRNAGFSSTPPVYQGCFVALGSVPGGSDLMAWDAGSDNANLSKPTPGGNGMWMSMVLNPTHVQPPGTSYYSANP